MSVPATLATKRLVTLQCCSVACVDTLRVSVALLRGPGGSADASQALARLVARVRVYMRVDKPSRRYPGFVNMLDLHRVLESHRADELHPLAPCSRSASRRP